MRDYGQFIIFIFRGYDLMFFRKILIGVEYIFKQGTIYKFKLV